MSDLAAEELALFGDGPVAPAEPDEFGWDEEPAAPEKSTMPGHTGAAVTDGPGWVSVECGVCGMFMGKRPPGHKIDPSLCPNVKSHDAASAARALIPTGKPPADIPAPSATEPVPASVPVQTPAPSVVVEKPRRGRPPKAAAPAGVPVTSTHTGEAVGFVAADPAVLTLRDQFAMAALAGLVENSVEQGTYAETFRVKRIEEAYRYADSMLKVRG